MPTRPLNLSKAQTDLLEQLGVHSTKGLSSDEVSARREAAGSFNIVDPPIKCPGWVCCLLPCIKSIPSMKAFQSLLPEDAEVLRNGVWIRYDAASLVKGDIIRLEEGDTVPADCIVLSLLTTNSELLVDHRLVTGEDKPRSSGVKRDGTTQPIQLFWGAQVVQGSAIAVVTAIGPNVFVALLIRDGRFPPKGNLVDGGVIPAANADADEEVGISLLTRQASD